MTIRSLKATARQPFIYPEELKGHRRRHWNDLVRASAGGELIGVTVQAQYEWALRHCGIRIHRSTFQQRLKQDVEALHAEDRRTHRTPSGSRGKGQATRSHRRQTARTH